MSFLFQAKNKKTPPDQYPVSSKMMQNALKTKWDFPANFPKSQDPANFGSLGIAKAGGIPLDPLNPTPGHRNLTKPYLLTGD